MSNKQHFFDIFKEIEHSSLFLTDRADQLKEEIQANCIQLSVPAGLQIESDELIDFLKRVRSNRQAQLQNSDLKTDLIYYLWHDEQAGQLRFNFINSSHLKLPFGAAVSLVGNEAEIVDHFLISNYSQGVAWEDFNAISEAVEELTVTFTLKVYQEIIFQSATHHPQPLR
ncbi:hypothetical protein [Hymenobacter ruricola]|uniref:Uncharacterized protein n=1 Tax=Hymenobacter ruricola TaxID=2791023 RepID=A0ABS0I5F3_9BACT|nr:hypothetical protein [Hymenobacter ruricola]MBF9222190.1 hypothetical protein [Hymenobacter ruricola]